MSTLSAESQKLFELNQKTFLTENEVLKFKVHILAFLKKFNNFENSHFWVK